MAEQNIIDLPKKITEQKNNDLIIFTTYTFDPIFFDAYILKKLKENNPKAAIIVLMDSKLKSKLEEKKDFTAQSGSTYALIGISENLFHPKIFMFGSKSKKKEQIFLGSHNLTNSGLAVNLELGFSSNDTGLFENCINYVHSLLKKNLSPNHQLFKKIEPFVYSKTKDQRLLTNENEPILDKCLRDVSKQLKSIDEIIIFSPFFSDNLKPLLEKIMAINPTEVKLCIQKNNHDLNPASVVSFNRLSLNEITGADTKQHRRSLHSKFIVFRGTDKDLILIGSPNFTRPALLETNSGGGNFESAILWEQNSDDFIDFLKIKPISENEVKTSQREFDRSVGSQTKTDTTIVFAFIDEFDKLQIDYKSETQKSVKLELYDEDQVTVSTIDFTLEKGIHSTYIPSVSSKINEICFTENDKRVSNLTRVCNLEKALNIRSVFNLKDTGAIDGWFGDNEDGTKPDLYDLAVILSHVDTAISDDPDDSTNSTDRGNTSVSGEIRPSGIRKTKSKSNNASFDFIKKMLKTSVKTQTGSTSEQKHGSITNPKDTDEIEKIKKLMKDLKDWFKRIIVAAPPKIPNLYRLFLESEIICLRSIESKNNEQDLLPATIINYLNEIIREDENFSKRDVDKIKIWAILLTLTKLYHKNLNRRYEFDNAEILCAFKPLFVHKKDSETYFVNNDIFEKLEKLPKFKNKIDNQAEFVIDDERIEKEISNYENKLLLSET